MKGRSQGGGPKISTKDKKKKHKPAALARVGSPAPAKEPVKKTPRAAGSEAPLSIKRQWDRHKEHVRNGVEPWTVFARARGTDDWLEVGSVTVDPGASETTPEQAVQLHKRLILSHSLRLHPTLSPFRNELDCGFTPPASEDKDQEKPEPVLLNVVDPGLPALCGFAGKPDESSGHYFVENEPLPEQGGKKVIRDKLGIEPSFKDKCHPAIWGVCCGCRLIDRLLLKGPSARECSLEHGTWLTMHAWSTSHLPTSFDQLDKQLSHTISRQAMTARVRLRKHSPSSSGFALADCTSSCADARHTV